MIQEAEIHVKKKYRKVLAYYLESIGTRFIFEESDTDRDTLSLIIPNLNVKQALHLGMRLQRVVGEQGFVVR